MLVSLAGSYLRTGDGMKVASVALIWLASAGAAAACDPGDQSCAGQAPPAIHVGAATYGGSCGVAYGNATQTLAASCNGKMRCDYTIDYRRIGDPAANCRKDFTAYWECGDGSALRFARVPPEAGFDKTITLDCAALAPEPAADVASATLAPAPEPPPTPVPAAALPAVTASAAPVASGGDAAARTAAVKICSEAIEQMRRDEFKQCQDFHRPDCRPPGKMEIGQSKIRGGEDFYSVTVAFKADGKSYSGDCTVDQGNSAGVGISEAAK